MREPATRERIEAFLRALAAAADRDTRCYLVGGTSAVLLGWRDSTRDVDLVLQPESDALLRAIPRLKESQQLNVEFAAPDHFIPVPDGWESRSPLAATFGRVEVRHYDLAAQALSKIERGHRRDLDDVRAMLDRGLITPGSLRETFAAIEPKLYRYPAVDAPAFKRALDALLADWSPPV
jgi:hypothetical protein